jgi:serine/threonine protein kinase
LKSKSLFDINEKSKSTEIHFLNASDYDVINRHNDETKCLLKQTKTFSAASDIWSLGCIIIELLTGKPPFANFPPDEARQHILEETPPIPTKASILLSDFLSSCFKANPNERPKVEDLLKSRWLEKFARTLNTDSPNTKKSQLELRPIQESNRDAANEYSPAKWLPLDNCIKHRENIFELSFVFAFFHLLLLT